MGFSERLSNGWDLTSASFKVLNKNKHLIIFPIITGISLLLVIGSFLTAFFAVKGWDIESLNLERGTTGYYLILFAFYIVNYFIVVFFNMALIHCARLYFRGEEPTISKGLSFSLDHIGTIFTWAVVAATVGTILKAIQDRAGFLGKIIIGLIGIVWSISTFFVLPVLAYEEVGAIDAVKRSADLMKQKWGESLTATFSFGTVQFLAIIAAIIPLLLIGYLISGVVAGIIGVLYVLCLVAVMSAVRTIFIAAVYETVNNNPVNEFPSAALDSLFISK